MKALNDIKLLEKARQDVATNNTLSILFADTMIGDLKFLDTYHRALATTDAGVPPWKHYRRAQRMINLARLFDHSLALEGSRIECGVYREFSSYFLAQIAQMRNSDFNGRDLHLIDSFEGSIPCLSRIYYIK